MRIWAYSIKKYRLKKRQVQQSFSGSKNYWIGINTSQSAFPKKNAERQLLSVMATLASYSLIRNTTFSRALLPVVKAEGLSISNTCKFLLPPKTSSLSRSLICTKAANNEEDIAKAAAVDAESGGPTIFDKIIAKKIHSTIVFEDESVLAFKDINPQAPIHVLVIPKIRDGLTELGKAEVRHIDILGRLLHTAKIVAEKEGILDGFRVVINNGPTACQSVYHLHLHVLGGRQMTWPPG